MPDQMTPLEASEILLEVTTLEVATQMELYGGSFVKCLAKAALCADSRNLAKLKFAWPEYWGKYENYASDAVRKKNPTCLKD